MQPETPELITLAAVYLHNFMRRNSLRYTYTPPGIFYVECPDTGEIRPGDWRNGHETRLEDFSRIACKSAIKAAQSKANSGNIFALSKVKLTGSVTTADYLLLYSIYGCVLFFIQVSLMYSARLIEFLIQVFSNNGTERNQML
jgi:hypothetical protein